MQFTPIFLLAVEVSTRLCFFLFFQATTGGVEQRSVLMQCACNRENIYLRYMYSYILLDMDSH